MIDSSRGSSKAVFQECHRKFIYTQKIGMRGIGVSMAAEQGSAIHVGLKEYYSNRGKQLPKDDLYLHCFAEAVRYLGLLNCDDCVKTVMEDKVLAGLDDYFEHYKEDVDLEVITTESQFTANFGGVDHSGTIDMFAKWKGGLMVVDHKTSSLSWDVFIKKWKDNLSLKGYVRSTQKLMGDPKIGLLLNLIRFRSTKKIEVEFDRVPIFFTEAELQDWEKTIVHIEKEIKMCESEGHWPKTGSACSSPFGDCSFRQVCSTGSDYQSYIDVGAYAVDKG